MPLDNTSLTPVANRMREILGPNGEHWCTWSLSDGRGNHCIMGAYLMALGRGRDASYNELCNDLLHAVRKVEPTAKSTPGFNNRQTSFEPIRRVIDAFAEMEAEKTLATKSLVAA